MLIIFFIRVCCFYTFFALNEWKLKTKRNCEWMSAVKRRSWVEISCIEMDFFSLFSLSFTDVHDVHAMFIYFFHFILRLMPTLEKSSFVVDSQRRISFMIEFINMNEQRSEWNWKIGTKSNRSFTNWRQTESKWDDITTAVVWINFIFIPFLRHPISYNSKERWTYYIMKKRSK